MLRGEGRPLNPTDVAHHLACQQRTQLERQRRDGTLRVAFAPDARLEGTRVRGAEHERAYGTRLRASGKKVVDLSATNDPSATLAAMRTGADVIVQAPLGSDVFFRIADVLLRESTPSKLGNCSYQPVDTKLAAETKPGALLQLLTYFEVLGRMQGTVPAGFFRVTPIAEEEHRTVDCAAYFRVIRDHVRAAHTATPPPSTYPDRVPHCDVCNATVRATMPPTSARNGRGDSVGAGAPPPRGASAGLRPGTAAWRPARRGRDGAAAIFSSRPCVFRKAWPLASRSRSHRSISARRLLALAMP